MPLSLSFSDDGLITRLSQVRGRRLIGYATALISIVIAATFTSAFRGLMVDGLAFIAFYIAVIVTTMIGGLAPGILAAVLSTIIIWYVFLPPYWSFGFDIETATSLLVFTMVTGSNVVIISLLSAALDRLFAHREYIRRIIEAAPNGMLAVDGRGNITYVNSQIETLFGYSRDELIGHSVDMLIPVKYRVAHTHLQREFLKHPQTRMMGEGRDLYGIRKDGTEFPVEIGLNAVATGEDAVVLATIVDITERKRAEERQELLIGELHHRTQNIFAVMQSVTTRSLVEGRPLNEIRENLMGRLRALSLSHMALTETALQGAALGDLIARGVSGFCDRVRVRGCDLIVSATMAQNFALIVHELATNAAKYGALSNPGGTVDIQCVVRSEGGSPRFSFIWEEQNGPPVMGPERRGFGSTILEMARQFSSDVVVEYDRSGFRYELHAPLEVIEAPPQLSNAALTFSCPKRRPTGWLKSSGE